MAFGDIGSEIGSWFDKDGSTSGTKTGKIAGELLGGAISLFSNKDDEPAPAAKKVAPPETKKEPAPETKGSDATSKFGKDGKIKTGDDKSDEKTTTTTQLDDKTVTPEAKDNNILRQFFQFLASIFGGGKIDFGDSSVAANGQANGTQNNRVAGNGQTPEQNQGQGKGLLGGIVDFVGGIFKGKETIENTPEKYKTKETELQAAFGKDSEGKNSQLESTALLSVQKAFENGFDSKEQKQFESLKKTISKAVATDGISAEENADIMKAIANLDKASNKSKSTGRSA